MAVSGTLRIDVSLTSTTTSNTAGTGAESLNLNTTPITITDGSGTNMFSKLWSVNRSLSASTPVTDDLTSLTGATGTVSFSTLKWLYAYNQSSTSTDKVTIGAAASNAFTGWLGGTTPTVDCYASSPIIMGRLMGSGHTVDGTHKSLKWDPGSTTQSIYIVLCGT